MINLITHSISKNAFYKAILVTKYKWDLEMTNHWVYLMREFRPISSKSITNRREGATDQKRFHNPKCNTFGISIEPSSRPSSAKTG